MANETKNLRLGVGLITVDTEVTETGEYPVIGSGIYKAIAGKKAENVAECTATTIAGCKESINAIISALIEAGLMEAPAEEEG